MNFVKFELDRIHRIHRICFVKFLPFYLPAMLRNARRAGMKGRKCNPPGAEASLICSHFGYDIYDFLGCFSVTKGVIELVGFVGLLELVKILPDRIHRIVLILCFSQLPDETEKGQSAFGGVELG